MDKKIKIGNNWVKISTYEDIRQELEDNRRAFEATIEEYKRLKANGELDDLYEDADDNGIASQEIFSEDEQQKFEKELPKWSRKESELIEKLEDEDKNKK